jgi:integrase/recombinase XerD
MTYIKDMTQQDQIEKLKIHCSANNFSDRTTENYAHPVDLFLTWLEKTKKEITRESIYEYQAVLKRKKFETATIKLHACAIRYYLRSVLNREDLVSSMPTIKQVSKLPVVLSKEEVKKMIGSALNQTHRMILTVLYSCGLRCEEMLSVRLMDIDFDRKNILIHGKGARDRFVPIGPKVISLIKETIIGLGPKDYLCTSIRRGPLDKSGRQLSKRTIGKIVETCARKAGITKRVYPHLLRHSVATHLIEDGVDIRYIQVLLGHSSILATAHYTQIATMPNNTMECKTNYLFD